jgi:hypothetical protein
VKVKFQEDGSIEILDIFRQLTVGHLEFILEKLKKESLFEDSTSNSSLKDEIEEIIFNKRFEKQMIEINEGTPEFKRMVNDLLDRLLKCENDLK